MCDRVGDELLAVRDFADVVAITGGFTAELSDGGDRFIGSGFIRAVTEGDVRTFGRKFLRDTQTDTLAGSGDSSDFTCEAVRYGYACPVSVRLVRYTREQIVARSELSLQSAGGPAEPYRHGPGLPLVQGCGPKKRLAEQVAVAVWPGLKSPGWRLLCEEDWASARADVTTAINEAARKVQGLLARLGFILW